MKEAIIELFLILGLSVGGTLLITGVAFVAVKSIGSISKLINKADDMNETFKCKCGIVSRRYQVVNGKRMICQHCGEVIYDYANRIDDNRKFPFAPKMSMREVYAKEREQSKIKKVKLKMKKLQEYDKEVESWEEIQLKKLHELEAKAIEIKAELAKGSVS